MLLRVGRERAVDEVSEVGGGAKGCGTHAHRWRDARHCEPATA